MRCCAEGCFSLACFVPWSHAIAARVVHHCCIAQSQRTAEQLSTGFERSHPDVRVKLYFDSGLDIRRTIAGMENSMVGQYFIGKGASISSHREEMNCSLDWSRNTTSCGRQNGRMRRTSWCSWCR